MDYLLSAMLFLILGIAYVKGYDVVKKRSPGHLVQFYMAMTVIRLLLVSTMAAIVILLFKESRDETIAFTGVYLIMYLAMMVITLSLRH